MHQVYSDNDNTNSRNFHNFHGTTAQRQQPTWTGFPTPEKDTDDIGKNMTHQSGRVSWIWRERLSLAADQLKTNTATQNNNVRNYTAAQKYIADIFC